MIKRIVFSVGDPGDPGDPGDLSSAAPSWVLDAPPEVRPSRMVVGVALAELQADPPHPAVAIEWFRDQVHLDRCTAWLAATGRSGDPGPDAVVVVAEEHVRRGQAWLDARWADGRQRLKHMALARRAHRLTPAEFSERWHHRAGRVGATPIPEAAKGCAYAQNHPLPRPDGDWRYDAVNEVWFDDEDALRTRIAWMDEAIGAGGDDDFISESAFLVVREELVVPR